jgi:hypothetical protein
MGHSRFREHTDMVVANDMPTLRQPEGYRCWVVGRVRKVTFSAGDVVPEVGLNIGLVQRDMRHSSS